MFVELVGEGILSLWAISSDPRGEECKLLSIGLFLNMRDTVFDRNSLYKRPSVIQILSFFLIETTLSWRLGDNKGEWELVGLFPSVTSCLPSTPWRCSLPSFSRSCKALPAVASQSCLLPSDLRRLLSSSFPPQSGRALLSKLLSARPSEAVCLALLITPYCFLFITLFTI